MENSRIEFSETQSIDTVHQISRRRGLFLGAVIGGLIGLPIGFVVAFFGSGVWNFVSLPIVILLSIRITLTWLRNIGVSVDALADLEIKAEAEVSWKVTTASSTLVGLGSTNLQVERMYDLDLNNKLTKTRYGIYQCAVSVTDGEGYLEASMRIGTKKSKAVCYEQGNIESLAIRIKLNDGGTKWSVPT